MLTQPSRVGMIETRLYLVVDCALQMTQPSRVGMIETCHIVVMLYMCQTQPSRVGMIETDLLCTYTHHAARPTPRGLG